jgi:hypothetical protein
MRTRLMALALLVPALTLAAASPKMRASGLVRSSKEAKAIAEQETGGKATSARRIPLNGASGGWEVDVRMPHEEKGWRCIIDADTRMVHSKVRIDQSGSKGKGEGPIRMVKGTR